MNTGTEILAGSESSPPGERSFAAGSEVEGAGPRIDFAGDRLSAVEVPKYDDTIN
jgi:hypothetical protein